MVNLQLRAISLQPVEEKGPQAMLSSMQIEGGGEEGGGGEIQDRDLVGRPLPTIHSQVNAEVVLRIPHDYSGYFGGWLVATFEAQCR